MAAANIARRVRSTGVAILTALVFLATLLATAPTAAAAHPYDPDYPDACAVSGEEPVNTTANPTGEGYYYCIGGAWYTCGGVTYYLPCKVCLIYTYDYDHGVGGTPRPEHTYDRCVQANNVPDPE